MPLTTADVPDPSKKTTPDPTPAVEPVKATPPKVEPKPEPVKPESLKAEPSKPPKKTGLDDAALSTDPLVQKLMWDRGVRLGSKDDRGVAVIDGELRKLGFDL